jgi:hypothetical protein
MLRELPWNWSDIVSSTKDGRTEFSEHDLIICKINNNTIKLGGIKFRIDSLVFETASVEEIIEGYQVMKSFCEVDRVIELLVTCMITRTNIQAFEPDVIDFAKICFWYNRIKNNKTIEHRRKEINSRLCKRLLYRLEKFKRTISSANLTEMEERSKTDSTLEEIRHSLTPSDIRRNPEFMNSYLNSLNVCISELMFPALAAESGLDIHFTPSNNPYDYDVIVEGHSTQIKNLFSYNVFPTSQQDIRKQEIYSQESNRIKELYDKKQITWDLVKEEIIKYIKSNGINKINDALRQGTSIVILDGTRTIPGLYLDYYYTDDSKYVKVRDSFTELMKTPLTGFMNIMFVSTTYDIKFRISSLIVKVPVEANQVNEAEKDEINIVNYYYDK